MYGDKPTTGIYNLTNPSKHIKMTKNYNTKVLVVLLALVPLIATFQESVIQIALLNLSSEYNVTYASLSIIVVAYTIPLSIFTLPFGKLGDIYQPKYIFSIGVGLLSIFSLGCGFGSSLSIIALSRCIQGIGLAAILATGISLLRAIYPSDQLAQGIGFWSASISLGYIIGPSLGGFSVEVFGWRAVFWTTGIIGLIIALLTMYWLPTCETQQTKFDYLGSILLAGFMLVMAFIFRPIRESGWSFTESTSMWIIAFIILGLFIHQERVNPMPLIEFNIFRRKVFWKGLICGMTYIATIKGLTFLLQYYLQSFLGHSPSESGIMWMIMSIATLFSNLVWGRFSDKYGNQRLIIYGGVLRFASLVLLAFLPFFAAVENVFWILGGVLVVFGLGTGITVTPLTSLIVSSFPQSQTGTINGVYSMARNLVGSFGILLFAQILTIPTLNLIDGSLQLSAISISFFLAALIGIGGVGFIIGLPNKTELEVRTLTLSPTQNNSWRDG